MKNKMTIGTLILSAVIVVLCVVMYHKYIYPIYLKNKRQTTQIELNSSNEIMLKKTAEQNHIYLIEIELTGRSNSNLSIIVVDSIGIPQQEIRLKKGDIDYIYKNDWYSPECKLQFSSKEKMSGKLVIDYRFLGL
ncbi:MAG TPA: hypothetical protein EYG86_01395 [Crocinitomicaceae bacterium]|nr:hypothetical protein [Crocinitomicaceae bacterium]